MTTLTETEGRETRPTRSIGSNWEPLKAFAVFLIIQIALVLAGVTPFSDGSLADPDSYMRLNRVLHLWDGGAWFDPVYPRIGPPDGHVQHWTRPMDLLLLAGAMVAAPFAGFEAGLHWWGVLVGPVMLLPTLMILIWAAKPLVRQDWLWLVGVLFVTQPAVLVTFLVGRPDHNCLLILLFVLYLALTIRLLMDPGRWLWAVLAGSVAAVALWVSVETMLFVVAGIAAPGLIWLLGERRLSHLMTIHAGALFAALAATLLLERGFGRFADVEFDQTSIAHLWLFAGNLAFWGAMDLVRRFVRTPPGWLARVLLSATLGGVVLAVIWSLVPGFFESPLARVDDLYRAQRLVNIEEIQPILHWSDLWEGAALAGLGRLFLWLGTAFLAVPALIWMVATRPAAEKQGWIALATVAAIFIPLACAQVRWLAYAEAVLLIPYACLVGLALDRINRSSRPDWILALPRALVVSMACVWFFGPAVLAGLADSSETAENPGVAESGGACPLTALSAFLADPQGLGGRPQRLMAFVDFGPELLYRTPHSVYSIPNHRYQPGFTTTYRIMTAPNPAAAQTLIRQSGVDMIVICPNWPVEALFYGGARRNPDGFYNDLAAGTPPGFLQAIPLPEDLGRHFRLFSVAGAP